MIVACSRCLSRFEAASYRDPLCPSCGALAQTPNVRPCPRCELPLAARDISGLVIDECGKCRGLFLDEVAIRRVLADEHHTRADALLSALPRGDHHPMPRDGARMYIKCPTCSTLMNRKLFATGSGVVVDVCKTHGTFFDLGELPAIIEFVRAGGLAVAAKKDAARRRERERNDANMRTHSSPGASDAGDKIVEAAALAELLAFVFG